MFGKEEAYFLEGMIQLVERLQHKVSFLEGIHAERACKNFSHVKGYEARLRSQAMEGLAMGRQDASTVYFLVVEFAHEAEFDGMPVHAVQKFLGARITVAQSQAAQSMEEVAVIGLSQKRDMSEDVMKHIGLLQVVELAHFPEPCGRTEFFLVE